jgi:hypothetical protein
MALVTKGTIEINGIVADVTEWSVSGGPTAAGKFGTNKQFLGYTETPATYEIQLSGLQPVGKPPIDFANLPPGFTLIRNFVGGARHQFVNTRVSNADNESASESEYTFEVTLLASHKVPQ